MYWRAKKLRRIILKAWSEPFFQMRPPRLLLTFQNDLYELYTQISADEDLDVFELIKELNPIANKDEGIKNLRRD